MSRADTQRVGVIGIGNMGWGMAARLLSQGWPVAVHDVDAERMALAAAAGASPSGSAFELAQRSDCVIVAVVDSAQTDAVLFGPLGCVDGSVAGQVAGQVVLLCPTLAPADTERFAARLAQRGIDCIDAPMSGGPARAHDGTMSLMLACADSVFERNRGLIEALSTTVFRIGQRLGDGARTKLVNNLLAAVNLAAAAEAMALAQRLGLDAQRTLDVIEKSSGQSWIGSERMRRALGGDKAVGAHMSLLAKDSALALHEAQRSGQAVPVGQAAAATFAAAMRDGLALADDSRLLDWVLALRLDAAEQSAR